MKVAVGKRVTLVSLCARQHKLSVERVLKLVGNYMAPVISSPTLGDMSHIVGGKARIQCLIQSKEVLIERMPHHSALRRLSLR